MTVSALIFFIIPKSGISIGMRGPASEAWESQMREDNRFMGLCVCFFCLGTVFLATGIVGYFIARSNRKNK